MRYGDAGRWRCSIIYLLACLSPVNQFQVTFPDQEELAPGDARGDDDEPFS